MTPTIGWGNQELQIYTAGSAAVAGGVLSISVERSNSGFTSARLTTAAKRSFAPGQGETLRIEGRIQLPSGEHQLPFAERLTRLAVSHLATEEHVAHVGPVAQSQERLLSVRVTSCSVQGCLPPPAGSSAWAYDDGPVCNSQCLTSKASCRSLYCQDLNNMSQNLKWSL